MSDARVVEVCDEAYRILLELKAKKRIRPGELDMLDAIANNLLQAGDKGHAAERIQALVEKVRGKLKARRLLDQINAILGENEEPPG